MNFALCLRVMRPHGACKSSLAVVLLGCLWLVGATNGWAQGKARQRGSVAATPNAKEVLQTAIKALGGETALRGIQALRWEAIRHTHMLEQSERPAGPWLVSYEQLSELRDVQTGSLRQTISSRSILTPNGDWMKGMTMIVAGGAAAMEFNGRKGPGMAAQAQEGEESLALAPERILFTALNAADLRAETSLTLQDVPHHVLAFTAQGKPHKLFLNAHTGLPTAAEQVSAHPYGMFSVWGDVTTRIYFSTWMLEAGGLHYPRQWDVQRNGMPYQSLTITQLTINPAIPADSFTIPTNIKDAYAKFQQKWDDLPLGFRGRGQIAELAEGVVRIPGSWDVTLVRQTDGIVILEAPISSGYSAKVIAEAEKRFPGVPIKAVVSTSDAWPHLAGVREYAARGIPIYALDVNQPLLEKVMTAPRRTFPDALAQTPKRPQWRIVAGKTVLGEGPNRLELYPLRTESGERMLMAYLPERRVLYAADLIQRQPDGSFFMPQYLSELMDAVAREKLTVERAYAMHSAPSAWQEITSAVQKAAVAAPREPEKANK